ncbi:hypothetical protein G7Y79_00047g083540 [Physcia stellaris]|nr:hypothetical protein G7Y79_00047g083540 [Physcia stellaris]
MEAQAPSPAAPPYEEWPSVPVAPLKPTIKDEQTSAMDIDEVMSLSDRNARQTSELSMDDIEAAQALEGLRADARQVGHANSIASKIDPALQSSQSSQPAEPLLSLFTSRHPLLSSTINGSLNAYSSSKSYSPSFRYGAEFVERISSPVVNTVGTAGRISGVETGVRWWLQRTDSSLAERRSKRRRTDRSPTDVDMERGVAEFSSRSSHQRRLSEMSYSDTLPPYDPQRSPKYEEKSPIHHSHDNGHPEYHPSWSTRLIKSTSGLGVAMSDESLASLRWALECLSWANRHLTRLIIRLRDAIEQSAQAHGPLSPQSNDSTNHHDTQMLDSEGPAPTSRERENHIQSLAAEVIYIIKRVNNGVSEYAASALPENARILVGRYLKSLRISFQKSFAQSDNTGDGRCEGVSGSEASARKALLLAKEALDKLAQVSGIVEGTIVSAEEWCDRLGRGRNSRSTGESSNLGSLADRKQPLVLTTVDVAPFIKDEKEIPRNAVQDDATMTDPELFTDNVAAANV